MFLFIPGGTPKYRSVQRCLFSFLNSQHLLGASSKAFCTSDLYLQTQAPVLTKWWECSSSKEYRTMPIFPISARIHNLIGIIVSAHEVVCWRTLNTTIVNFIASL